MTPIELFDDEGQSVWLDHATREAIARGELAHSVDRLGVSGLGSDLGRLHRAITGSPVYDAAIRVKALEGKSADLSLFEIVLEDAVRAADLLRPVWQKTAGEDGWVSAPLSPLLCATSSGALAAALELSDAASRPNLLVEIPGTGEGLVAVENAIFAGIAVNVTSLVSAGQYRRAADAYLRGLERRSAAGRDLAVGSVATVSTDCWESPDGREPRGLGVGRDVYKAYRSLLRSPRWQRLFRIGAHPQRLLWARKGTDHAASEFVYSRALAAPFTINAVSARVLGLFSSHGSLCTVPRRAGDAPSTGSVPARFEEEAAQLQRAAVDLARDTWRSTIVAVGSKGAALDKAS